MWWEANSVVYYCKYGSAVLCQIIAKIRSSKRMLPVAVNNPKPSLMIWLWDFIWRAERSKVTNLLREAVPRNKWNFQARAYLCVYIGSISFPGNAASPVCSHHRRPSIVSSQASHWKVRFPHISRHSGTHLDVLGPSIHHWEVGDSSLIDICLKLKQVIIVCLWFDFFNTRLHILYTC